MHGRISNSSTLNAVTLHRSLYTKGRINFVSVPKWSSESECGAKCALVLSTVCRRLINKTPAPRVFPEWWLSYY